MFGFIEDGGKASALGQARMHLVFDCLVCQEFVVDYYTEKQKYSVIKSGRMLMVDHSGSIRQGTTALISIIFNCNK